MNLTAIKEKNKRWFSKENKRFFGDLGYRYYKAKDLHFVIQITYGFSDLLERLGRGKRRIYYRLIPVNSETLELEPIHDENKMPYLFNTIEEAKEFAKNMAKEKRIKG